MIKTCQQCGAINGDSAELCCFCDAPLSPTRRAAGVRRVATPTEGNLAVQPEWRREVTSKLRAYHVRRHGGSLSELQTALPFEPVLDTEAEDSFPQDEQPSIPVEPAAPPRRISKSNTERFEISIPLQDTAEAPSRVVRAGIGHSDLASAPDGLFPVVPVSERCRAALLDAALLLFSFGGMLALFAALGGRMGFNKLDVIVAGATLALFYAQYFSLFTIFGGSTPGMMIRGLRVVSFDGGIPTSRQMAWRSLGYLVSAGTLLLGFVWALWDEDHLCWQDRLSQTYITFNEGAAASPRAAEAPGK